MRIYTLLKPGKYHPIHSEDYVFHQLLSTHKLIAAVMDGCSSGHESFFASALYAKSINKSCFLLSSEDVDNISNENIIRRISNQLFDDIRQTKKHLMLNHSELLSTLLLLVYDPQSCTAQVVISGDGVLACHGQLEIIDQNNVPDYMAYHLDQPFENWQKNHLKSMKFEDVQDIAISTDGLQKLVRDRAEININHETLREFLVNQPRWPNPRALEQLYHHKQQEGYITYDDLGVVRVINEN